MNPEVRLVLQLVVISILVLWLERNPHRIRKALSDLAFYARCAVGLPIAYFFLWLCVRDGLFDD